MTGIPVTASTGLVTASTGPSAEEDLSIPSRREIRYETLRVSNLMSLRGTAARGTISGRRPPVRVPWPYGINLQLVPESKIDCASHVLARSLFVQLKHAQNKFCGLRRRFSRALGTGRANGMLKLFLCPRAHTQIQNCVRTERRDRKTVWAKHGVEVRRPNVSRETIGKEDCTLSPFPCAIESPP